MASLRHLLPSWNVKRVELSRGETGDKNPAGDVQHCNIEEIRATELLGEAGLKDTKRDRRRKSL